MNKSLAIILTVAYALTSVVNAQAKSTGIEQSARAESVKNIYNPKPKPPQKIGCLTVEQIGWGIEIEPYFIPDGQSNQSNYQDYLSDLAWWQEQYPHACKVQPERIPNNLHLYE
jgi:hypothetical protein